MYSYGPQTEVHLSYYLSILYSRLNNKKPSIYNISVHPAKIVFPSTFDFIKIFQRTKKIFYYPFILRPITK